MAKANLPPPAPKTTRGHFVPLVVFYTAIRRDSRVGAVLREQNALPQKSRIAINLTAKAAIDNCRAGRAAKGENPSACATDKKRALVLFFYFYTEKLL
ncbi:MAG: hypothetical protein IJZ32_05035 [Clostridia bacterium]|nr:hypothetical protein [Clostridia bacterium]